MMFWPSHYSQRMGSLLQQVPPTMATPVAIIAGYHSWENSPKFHGKSPSCHLDGTTHLIRVVSNSMVTTLLTKWDDHPVATVLGTDHRGARAVAPTGSQRHSTAIVVRIAMATFRKGELPSLLKWLAANADSGDGW